MGSLFVIVLSALTVFMCNPVVNSVEIEVFANEK